MMLKIKKFKLTNTFYSLSFHRLLLCMQSQCTMQSRTHWGRRGRRRSRRGVVPIASQKILGHRPRLGRFQVPPLPLILSRKDATHNVRLISIRVVFECQFAGLSRPTRCVQFELRQGKPDLPTFHRHASAQGGHYEPSSK